MQLMPALDGASSQQSCLILLPRQAHYILLFYFAYTQCALRLRRLRHQAIIGLTLLSVQAEAILHSRRFEPLKMTLVTFTLRTQPLIESNRVLKPYMTTGFCSLLVDPRLLALIRTTMRARLAIRIVTKTSTQHIRSVHFP